MSDTIIPYGHKSPNRCPVCGSDAIEGGFVDIDGHYAYQECMCDCGAVWTDVYKLQGYILEHGPAISGKED